MNGNSKKIIINFYYYLLFLILLVLVGGRSREVGTDTDAYYRIFDIVIDKDFPNSDKKWEPLYQVLNHFTHWLGGDASIVILLSGFISLLSIFIFISKVSCNRFISVFLYVSVFGYLLSFNIVRHTLALSFLIWAIYFYVGKRMLLSLTFLTISFLFHYTVFIIFLLFYMIYHFLTVRSLFFIWFFSLVFLVFPELSKIIFFGVVNFIGFLIPDYYQFYVSKDVFASPPIGFKIIFNQIIVIFLLYFSTRYRSVLNHHEVTFIALSIFGVSFLNFFYHIQFFNRFYVFFEFFNVISIPILLKYSLSRDTYILTIPVLLLIGLYFLFQALASSSNGVTPYSNWIFG